MAGKLIKCNVMGCIICQNREAICSDCGAHNHGHLIGKECSAPDCADIKAQRKAAKRIKHGK